MARLRQPLCVCAVVAHTCVAQSMASACLRTEGARGGGRLFKSCSLPNGKRSEASQTASSLKACTYISSLMSAFLMTALLPEEAMAG